MKCWLALKAHCAVCTLHALMVSCCADRYTDRDNRHWNQCLKSLFTKDYCVIPKSRPLFYYPTNQKYKRWTCCHNKWPQHRGKCQVPACHPEFSSIPATIPSSISSFSSSLGPAFRPNKKFLTLSRLLLLLYSFSWKQRMMIKSYQNTYFSGFFHLKQVLMKCGTQVWL